MASVTAISYALVAGAMVVALWGGALLAIADSISGAPGARTMWVSTCG